MSEFRQRNIQKLYESIDNNLNHNDSNNINKSNNNVEIDNNNSNRKSLIFKNFNEKDEDKKKNIILLFLFLLIFRIINALTIKTYFNPDDSFVHQRGVVDVMNYFRYELKYQHQQQMLIEGGGLGGSEIGKNSSGASSGDNDVVAIEDIGFLMPCHSTPYYSNLNYNVTMWFITCEPPINSESAQENYLDESDFFYNNPVKFIYKYFKPTPKILLSNNSYDDDDSFSDLSPPSPSFYKEWPIKRVK
ncbi:12530_t:CDS:2 [Entrophospora sp. SA101]|nr:12530_t:CDS:2 [Entrophospora sp. SA101]